MIWLRVLTAQRYLCQLDPGRKQWPPQRDKTGEFNEGPFTEVWAVETPRGWASAGSGEMGDRPPQ